MRPNARNARNRAIAPRSNLSSPPVPASFVVEQSTQQELQLCGTIATARGARITESAWPAQPARQAYPPQMPGRDSYSIRGGSGGGRYPAGGANNRVMGFPGSGQDDILPHTSPRSTGQTPIAGATAAGRERGVVNSIQVRSVPVLLSLPTEAERNAIKQASMQEKIDLRNARREERRNRKLNRNIYATRESLAPAPNTGAEANWYNEQTGTGNIPNRHNGPNRAPPSPPPPQPPPPSPPPPPPPPSPPVTQQLSFGNDWRTWPEISVRVGPDIPLGYTTWDMYYLFSEYGVVESVDLFENSRGTRDGNGRVKFSYVRSPFWAKSFVTYEWHNAMCQLRIRLEPKWRSFTIPSPVNESKVYPEKFSFRPTEIDFGFMTEPNVMVAMYSTNDTDKVTFEVNLFRKQVDVIFDIYIKEEETPSDLGLSGPKELEEEAEKQEQNGRRESYRFRIPFAHLSQILEQGPVISQGNRVFLISLPSPPLFWRKLHSVAKSHDHNANYWSSWDMWFRQTGIAFDPLRRSKLPISLRQDLPIIDTGRWTTYRFTFSLGSREIDHFEQMISALKDFNVNTEIRDELRVTRDQPEPIWDSIDAVKTPKSSNSFIGDLSETLRPLLLYPIRYQLEVCISQNCLNEYNLTPEFIKRLIQLPDGKAISLLEHVADNKVRVYNPMDIFNIPLNSVPEGTAALKRKREAKDYQIVRKASITPSTVYYNTPTVEITNRVMRHYSQLSDRFLRVQFVDESFQGRINSTDKKTMHEVFSRVMTAMENGIKIGDRHFEFLAFGNSQVREHGAYFFASTDHTSAADIRAWMGDFRDIRVVAKHAARLGQCFSTTRPVKGVQVDVQEIEDLKTPDGEWCFSDGVGKISDFLSCMIAMELDKPRDEPPPSCVQFRLGGCKGVLTVWPEAKLREVCIRPSQRKFQAIHNTLEVIRLSKPAGAALNRQLIIVLSALGSQDNVFILKLQEMLTKLENAMHNPAVALSQLCRTIDANQFTLALAAMIRDKFMDFREPFVMSLLGLWRAWSIKYLKEKARITIEKGAFVLGVVDETGILNGYYKEQEEEEDDDAGRSNKGKGKTVPSKMPEIFLQISDPDKPGKYKVIEGLCIITRNPSLHPGDIRTVCAVNVPELAHLRNVVVFPKKGDRDLASMLSGGDLDGDDYIVIWDPELTFGIKNHKPMDFTPLEPRTLDRDVTVPDITKFFVNYMRNDKLGTIANAHLAWADQLEDGVKSDQCLRLAALHSDAVDYVKTGEPAEMPRDLRPKKYPHFMEKEPERTRQSRKILGRLYDMVEKVDFMPSYELQFDDRILSAYPLNEELLATAKAVKVEYDAALHRILAQHDIRTEFEVYSTFVMHHSLASKDYKFHEEIASIRDSLTDGFRKVVFEKVGYRDEVKLGPFVAAMYTVTKQEIDAALESLEAKKSKGKQRARTTKKEDQKFALDATKEMPLISFPWLFPEILGRLANREHPFGNIDNQSDGSLRQHQYEHVALPETKRGAAGRAGAGGDRFEYEIYDPEQENDKAANDLAGLESGPVEEYPGGDSKAYMSFDYKQDQQNPDRKATGSSTSKQENHNPQSGSHSIGEASSSSNTLEDEDEGLSFCEQLFKNMRPENELF